MTGELHRELKHPEEPAPVLSTLANQTMLELQRTLVKSIPRDTLNMTFRKEAMEKTQLLREKERETCKKLGLEDKSNEKFLEGFGDEFGGVNGATLRSTLGTLRKSEPRTLRTSEKSSPISDALVARLAVTPYTRMVFVFKYTDDETLSALHAAVAAVNLAALPDIQGTLRSYSFTDDEVRAANSADLDVVCGFTIIDDDVRVVVIEGLAGPSKGMQEIFLDIPRLKPNDKDLKILCNPEILFPNRLYTEFGPDIKRIRVRDKLKKLARRPELYNRNQVELICFEAVDAVMSLRRAVDLRSTKDFQLYPTAEALNKLELLYGEAISRVDLDGAEVERERISALKAKAAAQKAAKLEAEATLARTAKGNNGAASSYVQTEVATTAGVETSASTSKKLLTQRCPPTDCWNKGKVILSTNSLLTH